MTKKSSMTFPWFPWLVATLRSVPRYRDPLVCRRLWNIITVHVIQRMGTTHLITGERFVVPPKSLNKYTFFYYYKKLVKGPSTECFLIFLYFQYWKFLAWFLKFTSGNTKLERLWNERQLPKHLNLQYLSFPSFYISFLIFWSKKIQYWKFLNLFEAPASGFL